MRLKYDSVMITGGAGFIGSHTVDALVENGIEVWVLDNLSSGSFRNLKHMKRKSKFHFKKGDVRNYKTVESLTRKVDAILHLAAMVNPHVSMQKPEFAREVNVLGTLNVLRAGLASHVHRIVFASSSSVYGDSTYKPISENALLNPITPYGASKLAAEKYCSVYHKAFGLNTISLRYFNVYGKRQGANPYSGVVAIFAHRLRKNMPPIIYGDGKQTRDFIHVSDVVRANLLALQTNKGIGEALNVGTGQATTILQLYRLLATLMARRNLSPVFAEARTGDIRLSCANITKARALLGFEPK